MKDNSAGAVYRSRVEAAITYIGQGLDGPLDLKHVAAAGGFSPFHFHRIFAAATGETPQDFVNRVRLEKAANMLLKSSLSITEIALACGFSSSAAFARSFKGHFGLTASEYARSAQRGPAAEARAFPSSPEAETRKPAWNAPLDVRVTPSPGYHVAYVANIKGYSMPEICRAWDRLCKWAYARDLLSPGTRMIGISFDDPLITPRDRCRYYACVTVPKDLPPDPAIGRMDIPGGKCAVCHVTCRAEQIEPIYQAIYGNWLPDSGFQPADFPCYEIYEQTPQANPDGKYVMDICIPVVPL